MTGPASISINDIPIAAAKIEQGMAKAATKLTPKAGALAGAMGAPPKGFRVKVQR